VPSIPYPITFDGVYYTVTIDMSLYPKNRHSNTVNNQGAYLTAISIFPNPATTILNFSFPASSLTTIKMTDMAGRVIDTRALSNVTETTLNVAGYAPGIYLYQVVSGSVMKTGKVTVR
jgi:hypothetical protein